MDSLDDLLYAARNSDRAAESQLFSKLHARISKLVKYKLQRAQKHPSEVAEDVNDLVAEIMETIRQKYKTADFRYGFMAWMNAIVWNKVGSYIRFEKKQVRTEVDWEKVRDDPRESPDQILEKNELQEMIYTALQKMKAPCKEIMQALLEEKIDHYVSQCKKAAPEGTIYSQIHRCRARFRKALKELGFEYEVYRRKYRSSN